MMKALLNIFKHLKSKSWAIAKIVPLSLLGFDHQIRNYVTVFSKLEKNLNEF